MSEVSIYVALAAARKNMSCPDLDGVARTGKGGSREYKYATLSSVLKSIMEPLLGEGIFFTQHLDLENVLTTECFLGEQKVILDTRRVIRGGSAQDEGSAETYAKRYAICSVFGLAGEDDDDGGSGLTPNPKEDEERKHRQDLWKEIGTLKSKAIALGITEAGITSWIEMTYKGKDMKTFNEEEIMALRGYLASQITDMESLKEKK
ncbi:MAG: ERF family protein [Gordonibacter sp.]|uniref:ERF family protein n=1 Tax=Gordonibacter sp. TaxID=1968902 RepID=UPI002FC813DC